MVERTPNPNLDGRTVISGRSGSFRYCARPVEPLSASSFRKQVWISRLVYVYLLAVFLIYADGISWWLGNVYKWLTDLWLFRHDSFEPMLVVTMFIVNLVFWWSIDKFSPFARAYRIQDSDDMAGFKDVHGRWNEFMWYLGPLIVFDMMFPRRHLLLSSHVHGPSVGQVAWDVIAAISIYDVLFFLWHVTSHHVPLLYDKVHAKHHTHSIVRACEVVRNSPIDVAVDSACSVIALNFTRCHPLSRSVYNIVIITLLTELHAGYDLPFSLHNILPQGFMGGAPRHDIHHRMGQRRYYFQKFFTFLDEAFGFVEPLDHPKSEARIRWWSH